MKHKPKQEWCWRNTVMYTSTRSEEWKDDIVAQIWHIQSKLVADRYRTDESNQHNTASLYNNASNSATQTSHSTETSLITYIPNYLYIYMIYVYVYTYLWMFYPFVVDIYLKKTIFPQDSTAMDAHSFIGECNLVIELLKHVPQSLTTTWLSLPLHLFTTQQVEQLPRQNDCTEVTLQFKHCIPLH